ncbi:hypothetical protein L1987_10063 [Smallanthus sonchifolius]|uniref:Uncharacterized protein n=1 Tax=Smallanthus sonchifolius TaxID=185202 RepID=A0ACB9JR26_9ASTR|nr:hypothetical protein L1987_10063 [Smallanthus sonchifolius]
MAAGAVETDLELAYRLQLEEAMAASLGFQPSSSNSSLQSPQPSPHIPIHDDVKLADKFETVVKDRMIIETETKKLQVDLNRRIHDQKLAREVLQTPEEQMQVVGDNGEGSSKSEEVFRVYFKGLLSEERVHGDKTVTMAGIGVAICDSTDEMFLR